MPEIMPHIFINNAMVLPNIINKLGDPASVVTLRTMNSRDLKIFFVLFLFRLVIRSVAFQNITHNLRRFYNKIAKFLTL